MKVSKFVCGLLLACLVVSMACVSTAHAMNIPFSVFNSSAPDQLEAVSTQSLGRARVSVDKGAVYTGDKIEPAVTVKLGDETLIEGYDYLTTYKNNVDAGKARVVVRGINTMKGKLKSSFTIEPHSLEKDNVKLEKKSYYLGRDGAHPKVIVSFGERELVEGSDYETELKDCDKVGTGSVIVKGIGNFTGSVEVPVKILPDNSVPVLSHHEMMLDVDRFTVSDIDARISIEDGMYTPSDIKWDVSNTSVIRLASWSDSELVESNASGSSVCIEAVAFGEADLVATLPNGKTDTCHVKVISPCDDPTGRTRTHDWNGRTYSLVEGSWGNEYVDAYLNNAERMMAKHPEFGGFGKDLSEREIWGYWQNGLSVTWNDGDAKFKVSAPVLPYKGGSGGMDEVHMTKHAGELSANGWVLLETSKNQWQYLCQKINGSWKVIDARAGAAGPNFNYFDGWIGVVWHSPFGLAGTYGNNHQGMGRYTWLVHSGAEEGYPASHGCLHLGNYSSQLYWDVFMRAGRCTRVIAY